MSELIVEKKDLKKLKKYGFLEEEGVLYYPAVFVKFWLYINPDGIVCCNVGHNELYNDFLPTVIFDLIRDGIIQRKDNLLWK